MRRETTTSEVSRGDVDPLGAMLDAALQRLAAVPRAISAALIRRAWLPNQVALYQADRLATRAAGNEAMISTLQKLRWDYTAANAVHRAIQSHVPPERVFDEMRAALAALPEPECERLRRSADREEHMVARGEPPLAWRIELLWRQAIPARVTCDVGSAARLREELAVAEAALAQRMIDDAG